LDAAERAAHARARACVHMNTTLHGEGDLFFYAYSFTNTPRIVPVPLSDASMADRSMPWAAEPIRWRATAEAIVLVSPLIVSLLFLAAVAYATRARQTRVDAQQRTCADDAIVDAAPDATDDDTASESSFSDGDHATRETADGQV
jgi:hypothetical protein